VSDTIAMTRPRNRRPRVRTRAAVALLLVTMGLAGSDIDGPAEAGTGPPLRFQPKATSLLVVPARELSAGPLTSDLYQLNPQGSSLRRLTSPLCGAEDPSVAPDGSAVVFACETTSGSRLYVVRIDGGHRHQLLQQPVGVADFAPAWSPDGAKVAFVRRHSLSQGEPGRVFIADADGRNAHALPLAPDAWSVPAWSPDGRALLVASVVGSNRSLYQIDALTGKTITRLRRIGDVAPGFAKPAWRPTGGAIAYDRIEACPGTHCEALRVYIYQFGSVPERVADDGRDPSWSPNGRLLSYRDSVGATIKAYDIGTGSTSALFSSTRLTFGAQDWVPRCGLRVQSPHSRLVDHIGGRLVCGSNRADTIVSARGADHIFGGEGNDVISAANGRFDLIGCGPGADSVIADWQDHVGSDCERLHHVR
jgi:dipeptidyl aminopeptidase/acylaminoacyl peptidase